MTFADVGILYWREPWAGPLPENLDACASAECRGGKTEPVSSSPALKFGRIDFFAAAGLACSKLPSFGGAMNNLCWLTDERMVGLRLFFPKSHGRPRVDDRRMLSGIIFVNCNGLRWRDAPAAYGQPKTLDDR